MTRTSIFYSILLTAAFILVSESSFAQDGPCLLGVGNCPRGNPTVNPGNVDRGNRSVHITDARAGEIWEAKKKNRRYLLVLQTYNEGGLMCEERAWVGGSYSGDASQVVVDVGPTKKVCYDPRRIVWTAQQVNNLEVSIDAWTNSIYEWTKYEERCVAYVNQYRNNPQAVAYGQSEIKRSQAWADYYRKLITTYRNAENQFAP